MTYNSERTYILLVGRHKSIVWLTGQWSTYVTISGHACRRPYLLKHFNQIEDIALTQADVRQEFSCLTDRNCRIRMMYSDNSSVVLENVEWLNPFPFTLQETRWYTFRSGYTDECMACGNDVKISYGWYNRWLEQYLTNSSYNLLSRPTNSQHIY